MGYLFSFCFGIDLRRKTNTPIALVIWAAHITSAMCFIRIALAPILLQQYRYCWSSINTQPPPPYPQVEYTYGQGGVGIRPPPLTHTPTIPIECMGMVGVLPPYSFRILSFCAERIYYLIFLRRKKLFRNKRRRNKLCTNV